MLTEFNEIRHLRSLCVTLAPIMLCVHRGEYVIDTGDTLRIYGVTGKK